MYMYMYADKLMSAYTRLCHRCAQYSVMNSLSDLGPFMHAAGGLGVKVDCGLWTMPHRFFVLPAKPQQLRRVTTFGVLLAAM